jgi:DNA-binding NarL/FixJ family response regulator
VRLAERIAVPEILGRACRAYASTLDDAGAGLTVLHEAVRLLESSNARLEHARALIALAAAERAHGDPATARELAQRSQILAEQLGASSAAGAARRELLRAGGRPRRAALHGVRALTTAELKVATLAAEGMTNPQIADQLVLATKTIEGHLANTYRKLDINRRAQLAPIIVPSQVAMGTLGQP